MSNEYLAPTLGLVQHLQQHRGSTQAFLNGDRATRDTMTQKQTAIAEDMRAIDAVDRKHGGEFQTTARWESLKSEWRDLQSQVEKLSANDSFNPRLLHLEN